MAETEHKDRHPLDETGRYAGYDRIMGSISWLLIALVLLDMKLMGPDERSATILALFCFFLLAYNMAARYLILRGTSSRGKTLTDLMIFLLFIVGVSWFTGKATSPFVSLIYLVLMATFLTQRRRVTYFMAGLAISSYVLLSSGELLGLFASRRDTVGYLLQLFPFLLIAHLGAMLSGEAEHARREIEKLSLTDEVTGLSNMRNFFHLAEIQEKLAKRYHRPFTICMLDADNLKKINDVHGHFAGTELIRHTARLITQCIRCTDIAARYGGDEFAINVCGGRQA
ncbi:GGDEF domain-containing protein [Geobacter sp.]|uniref:GGDEF domain-containing protein n=1 Tax=Geobacter sp. TaxID=46610 RepID=UPI002607C465|nr:GGDEF domain-containing protein [Geobacter sp.]